MKTAELTGRLLRQWVARANGWKVEPEADTLPDLICWDENSEPFSFGEYGYCPDLNWAQGGPIIARARMNFVTIGTGLRGANGRAPIVAIPEDGRKAMEGETHLIAAMRAYVASVYGAEVPDEVAP